MIEKIDDVTYMQEISMPSCPNCNSNDMEQDDEPFFMSPNKKTYDICVPLKCVSCNYSFSMHIYFNK